MDEYTKRLNHVIPGGAHTYSRGWDQFSANTPGILTAGKGSKVYDINKKEYLDYGMALRAVNIGYAHDEINEAAIKQIHNGVNLTRPSEIELEAAELFVSLIDSVDMVKFTKNGSSAVSAGVKLSRAYTGRDYVARCIDHPFFSYDDWFISSTPLKKGIPASTEKLTLTFAYNDIASLEALFERHPNQIACVVLEPSTLVHPAPSKLVPGENFLHDVKRVCEKNGAVFMLDEMITGFRWHLKGAQYYYNIKPDLCTFGKGMANGYAVAAIAGKREIMELGSTLKEGQERVFLLSTTHGAEMPALGAFVKTIEILKRDKGVEYVWNYGEKFLKKANDLSAQHGLSEVIKFSGIACAPIFLTYDKDKNISFPMRTLFQQEMVKNGVMMPWLALAAAHSEADLELSLKAMNETFKILTKAVENGWEKYLEGHILKPVFRKYN